MKRAVDFEPVPSIDLLGGQAVRLIRGEFASAVSYGDPMEIVDAWSASGGRLHVVDLEAARRGRPVELAMVARLARVGFELQVGGGVRSAGDAQRWLDRGAAKVVVGTAATNPATLESIVERVGRERVIAAVDLRRGVVRTEGWRRSAAIEPSNLISCIEQIGIGEVLVTDIDCDGTMRGPSRELYRALASSTSLSILASGGVASLSDVSTLARIDGLSGVVIGKALHEKRFTLAAARARAAAARSLCERVIPCLDISGGRVVKGTRFFDLRDAGDPVDCARRYEAEGADELVVLDVSATAEQRSASLETVARVADSLYIPLTVGGGVRSVADFRRLIQAGADRVAVNTAAVERPALLRECADELGVQAVVLACDARRCDGGYRVVIRAGRDDTALEAAEWCRLAEDLGAGEILLTSIDRDGTREGFDIELLRSVSGAVGIGLIASGGAGDVRHFAEAIEVGGARGVLAASLFHEQALSIGDVKQYLSSRGVPVR